MDNFNSELNTIQTLQMLYLASYSFTTYFKTLEPLHFRTYVYTTLFMQKENLTAVFSQFMIRNHNTQLIKYSNNIIKKM